MTLLLCFVIALDMTYIYEAYFDDSWWDEEFWTAYPGYIIGLNGLIAVICLMITIIGG